MLKFNNLKIIPAKGFKMRFLGLMFKKKITYALVFKNCHAIHTFFMMQNIDIIMTDKNDNIIKTLKNIKKGQIIFAPLKTKYIYELPCGTIK